jgi:hypothetical protein
MESLEHPHIVQKKTSLIKNGEQQTDKKKSGSQGSKLLICLTKNCTY